MTLEASLTHVERFSLQSLQVARYTSTQDGNSIGDVAIPISDLRGKRFKEVIDMSIDVAQLTLAECKKSFSAMQTDMQFPEDATVESLLVQAINIAMVTRKYDCLPVALRPKRTLGEDINVGISVFQQSNGNMTVMKCFVGGTALTVGQAKAICHGSPKTWDYKRCANSDAFRKAVVHLVQSCNDHHWQLVVLKEKLKRGTSASVGAASGEYGKLGGRPKTREEWTPAADELKAGIHYINFKAPLTDGMNEQFL